MGWGDALLRALGGTVGGLAGGLLGGPAGFAAGAGFGSGLGGLAADAMTNEDAPPAMQGMQQSMMRRAYQPTAIPQMPQMGQMGGQGIAGAPGMQPMDMGEDPRKLAARRYAERLRGSLG